MLLHDCLPSLYSGMGILSEQSTENVAATEASQIHTLLVEDTVIPSLLLILRMFAPPPPRPRLQFWEYIFAPPPPPQQKNLSTFTKKWG